MNQVNSRQLLGTLAALEALNMVDVLVGNDFLDSIDDLVADDAVLLLLFLDFLESCFHFRKICTTLDVDNALLYNNIALAFFKSKNKNIYVC